MGFLFLSRKRGVGGVWTLSFPDQIFQFLIFLTFFLGPRDPFKITLGTISSRSVPVAPLGMVWSSSYEGFCVFCFHPIFPFFMEGEKYFGGKMNPPGCFSTEEGKEILWGGGGGGVTPPLNDGKTLNWGRKERKSGRGGVRGSGKSSNPPRRKEKGGLGGVGGFN